MSVRDTLPKWAKPGTSFNHPRGDLFHIRALVDGRAVCRFWRYRYGCWQYEVFDGIFFGVNRDIEPRHGEGSQKDLK